MSKKLDWRGERLTTDVNNRIALEHLHRYALTYHLISNKIVLDIACGEGYGSYIMSRRASKVYGVDISDDAIAHAKRKYNTENLTFLLGSALNIPFPANFFDIVVSFETIEHLGEHKKLLSELKRVLNNDGILIISSPDKQTYSLDRCYNNPFHVKELFINEFKELMKEYFNFCEFLNQKTIYNSVIVSEGTIKSFNEIQGNFSEISINNFLSKPMFNIAICSDIKLSINHISIFNGEDIFNKIIAECEERTKSLMNLIKYLFRKLITKLQILFKNFIK